MIRPTPACSRLRLAAGGGGLRCAGRKWGSLPEPTPISFFACSARSSAFGSLVILAMIGILGYAGIRIAMHADDLFVRYAAGGITAWFMVQALINLAVVLRMPIAGVPLPLVSYGGSALIANLLAVGVLLACARREPEAASCWPRGNPARAADDDSGRLPDALMNESAALPSLWCSRAAGLPDIPRR